MSKLTKTERAKFTKEQLVQMDRLSATRRDGYLAAPEGADPTGFRARMLTRLSTRTPESLRVRVNTISFEYGKGVKVNYAPENDYTPEEMEAIAESLQPGDKPLFKIPEILAEGSSVKQRLKALEGV